MYVEALKVHSGPVAKEVEVVGVSQCCGQRPSQGLEQRSVVTVELEMGWGGLPGDEGY